MTKEIHALQQCVKIYTYAHLFLLHFSITMSISLVHSQFLNLY